MEPKKKFKKYYESLTIPADHIVCDVDLDSSPAFVTITNAKNDSDIKRHELDEHKVFIPEALAYYLTKHSCGSQKMIDLYKKSGKNEKCECPGCGKIFHPEK